MIRKPETVRTWVGPTGPLDAKLAGVGEQPGKQEIFHRPIPTPFVGPAGQELDKCFDSAYIPRRSCYLTNVIKDLDHPLHYYMDISKKNPVISQAGQMYIDMLKEELIECNPNVVVTFGNIPLFALTNRTGITKWRGSVLESTLIPGLKVVPTIHPATIIPPKNVYLNKNLIILDLQRAKEESAYPEIRRKERKIHTRPSFGEAMHYIERARQQGKEGGMIDDFDIEIYNEEVSCISFALSSTEVMSIPLVDSSGDYFSIDQEAELWRAIANLLEDRDIWKRGQNIAFDSHFLLRRMGIKAHSLHDTMVAQKTLFPDYPMGLDFICTMYTDIPYYKNEGKKWFKAGGAWENLWQYNALDSIVCADAHPQQMRDLERQGNLETYERQRKIVEPLVYMMERGIRVDVENMKKRGEEYGEKIETTTAELQRICGFDINPNSPKQLANYFYGTRGLPAYRKRGGGVTTDDDALKRLIRKGIKEAGLIKEIRKYTKARGNYLNIDKVDSDSRIRCSYNPAGTRFSRISSSENIFGTGMNMQNWPHDLLRYLLADEGYVLYTVDLSQAENRIVAYVGNVTPWIEAFEAGRDVHNLTASLLLGKPVNEISDEDGSSPLGNGEQSERYWGKKANHELDYDMGYKTFSLQFELPETQGKWLVERFHLGLPGIRQNYHTMVKLQLGKNRTLTNLMGRKTLFLGEWGDRTWKIGFSCIPQGTVGDVINERGLNYIYYHQQAFKAIELLTQVHDSITFQIPVPDGREWCRDWNHHAVMLDRIKRSLETPLVYNEREFVIPVDVVMGLNFRKEEGVKIKTVNAQTLEEAYNDLRKQNANVSER